MEEKEEKEEDVIDDDDQMQLGDQHVPQVGNFIYEVVQDGNQNGDLAGQALEEPAPFVEHMHLQNDDNWNLGEVHHVVHNGVYQVFMPAPQPDAQVFMPAPQPGAQNQHIADLHEDIHAFLERALLR